MIYIMLFIKHKIQKRMNKKRKLLHTFKNYVAVLKVQKKILKSKEQKLMFK